MIPMNVLRFIALTHDIGKVFDRKNHQKAIIKVLFECSITNWEIIACLKRFHQRGNGKDYLYLVRYADQYSFNELIFLYLERLQHAHCRRSSTSNDSLLK